MPSSALARARRNGFRFKDWTDYQANAQPLGTGDRSPPTSFQLAKRYPSGSEVENRTITKPVAGTVKVYRDGVQAATGWSVEHHDRPGHVRRRSRRRRRPHRRLRVRPAGPVRHRPDGDHHRDLRARQLGPNPRCRDPIARLVPARSQRFGRARSRATQAVCAPRATRYHPAQMLKQMENSTTTPAGPNTRPTLSHSKAKRKYVYGETQEVALRRSHRLRSCLQRAFRSTSISSRSTVDPGDGGYPGDVG